MVLTASAVELAGVRVTRKRFRESYNRVRINAESIRPRIRRRNYLAKGPRSVWHIDGHHKLIRHYIIYYCSMYYFFFNFTDGVLSHTQVLTDILVL